ncbi:MAG: glycosyltransferase [Tepidisphaeraceae bacterium]|jgi:GT2 family glycosyltransferase
MTERDPLFSVIICSIDSGRFERVSEMYRRVLAGQTFEIIGIHDAKGICEGYTRGIERAKGEILFFSHDDVEFVNPKIGQRVLEAMEKCDVMGIAGTTRLEHAMWSFAGPPYLFGQVAHPNDDGTYAVQIFATPAPLVVGMQALDGCCLIAHRRVLKSVQFDAERFKGFHLYDADFTFSAHLAGLRVAVCCDLALIHRSKGLLTEEWNRDWEIFQAKHGFHLYPYRRRAFANCEVAVQTRADVLEVMTPRYGA